MEPYFKDETSTIQCGNCKLVLPLLSENSIDSIVTDPPYELGFMGKFWDKTGVANDAAMWAECLRVLKPGGYLLSFGGSRTYHRMACAIEDAGFEIRDQIQWIYGSGFPKSHNLDGEWKGWGTALKPAHEPIVVARKPIKGTVAANVQKWGTGALNIDKCRVQTSDILVGSGAPPLKYGGENSRPFHETAEPRGINQSPLGRWPANVIHDGSEEVLDCFPDAPGQCADVKYDAEERKTQNIYGAMKRGHEPSAERTYAENGATDFAMRPGARRLDAGSAARFFYCAKADNWDRNEGLDGMPKEKSGMVSNTSGQHITRRDGGAPGPKANHHPTVKPTDLMRYLCRLITQPGGIVLDPFMGSGSTRKACIQENLRFIGIEIEEKYCAIAVLRAPQSVLNFTEEQPCSSQP